MYRFASSPRWIAAHVLVLVVAVLFAAAGLWQLDRLSERRERNALVTERRSMPIASIREYFGDPDEAAHRRVRAVGRYDTGREVVLLGRGNEGRSGNHVLTPLVLSGGRAVIVDRGWIPPDLGSTPVIEAMPPGGEVEVTGIALPSEGSGPLASDTAGEPGEAVSRIDVARIGRHLPYTVFPFYVVLGSQEPPQSEDLPDPVTLAELGEGSHLVYAVQWFLFIPIGLIGYAAILRREAKKHRFTPANVT